MFSQSNPQDKGFVFDEKHLTHTIMSVKTIFSKHLHDIIMIVLISMEKMI